MNIIETKRLVLREFVPEDAEDNYRIYQDPRNMEFMGPPPPSVEDERDQILKHIATYYRHYGFGLWATVLKKNKRLLGRCGLLYQEIENQPEVEFSYLIDRLDRGQGLATEAAREIVKLGFGKF